jgi:cytochrome b6-f complex iron-sulfur subunit
MSAEIQTRREFVIQACQTLSIVAIGSVLPPVLQGCGSGDNPAGPGNQGLPTITATESGGKIAISIGTSSPLAAVGSAAQVQYQGGILLVARTGESTFAALTAVCTHQGCTITGYGSGTYTCPCHGSQFSTDGQVTRGPAGSPLHQYQTAFSNGTLTITL